MSMDEVVSFFIKKPGWIQIEVMPLSGRRESFLCRRRSPNRLRRLISLSAR